MPKTPRQKPAAAAAEPTPPEIRLLGAEVEIVDLDDLFPYDRNTRIHPPEQKAALEDAMRAYGWTAPLLIREDGGIIAGHLRWEVATDRLGLKRGPAIVARGWSEEQIRAYVIWDNRSAEMAAWDLATLKFEVGALDAAGFDLGLVGFDLPGIEALELGLDPAAAGQEDDEGTYSRKIETPIYTPRGDQPDPSELYDNERTHALMQEIAAADLPEDVRAFLVHAAQRHTVFDFHRIADFYAAAPAATQRLMERSALVIIDFNSAIENGFVSLNERLAALAGEVQTADA